MRRGLASFSGSLLLSAVAAFAVPAAPVSRPARGGLVDVADVPPAAPPGVAPPGAVSTPAPPPPPPSTAKVDARGVLGRTVQGEKGNDIGKIVDVLVDQTGAPRAAVIDFGGFMGVGDRRIAVDWSSLKFPAPGAKGGIKLALSEDEIAHAPDYKEAGKPPVVVGPPSPAPQPGP